MNAHKHLLDRRKVLLWTVLLAGVAVLLGWALFNRQPRPLSPRAPEIASRKVAEINLSDYTISLERTSCYGPCPIYQVTIHGDGRVTFDGPDMRKRFHHPGKGPRFIRSRRIRPDEHLQTVRMIEQGGFWKLNARYVLEPYRNPMSGEWSEIHVTDNPTAILTVKRGMQRKSVEQHIVPCEHDKHRFANKDVSKAIRAYMPDLFCDLATTIDVVTCAGYWGGQAVPVKSYDDAFLLSQARCETSP
ncbi:MAG: DUF6438 domain-containing protein [Luteimonas sp.]